MRLIDAENFSKSMKDYFTDMIINRKYNVDCVDCNADLQRLLDNHPTTYDVDKIVEELKTDSSVKLYGSQNSDNYMIPVNRAIEIVKHGVISDDVCEWKYNDTEYYWESSCDHLHIFMSDGPKENEYEFCPYCGKKIKVIGGGVNDD